MIIAFREMEIKCLLFVIGFVISFLNCTISSISKHSDKPKSAVEDGHTTSGFGKYSEFFNGEKNEKLNSKTQNIDEILSWLKMEKNRKGNTEKNKKKTETKSKNFENEDCNILKNKILKVADENVKMDEKQTTKQGVCSNSSLSSRVLLEVSSTVMPNG